MKAILTTSKSNIQFILDELGDILEKEDIVIKIISDNEFKDLFSTKTDIQVDLSDEDFMELAKIAHEKNITFNQLVNNILREEFERKTNEDI